MEDEDVTIVVKNVYGNFCIRKARRKRQKKLVQEMMYDYANNTTLHGLPYTTRKGLTMIEKIFWLITFITSVCICTYYISYVWLKWKTSPVLVTLSEHLVPVSKIPFPSVTICPQTKCISSTYNFTEHRNKFLTLIKKKTTRRIIQNNETLQDEIEKFEDILQVCDDRFFHGFNLDHPRIYSDNTVIDNIMEVSADYKDVFQLACAVGGVQVICKTLFKKVLTSEGLCYNFNSKSALELFRENSIPRQVNATMKHMLWNYCGYANCQTETWKAYKNLKGKEYGNSPDLEIYLIENEAEKDDWCNTLNSGYKVYVQNPSDVPQSSLYYYAVLKGQVSSMALDVSIINTSEALRRYSPQLRQCYLSDERYLKHFQIYTASNCRLECLANITLIRCGCVGFYMPFDTLSNDTKICTQQQARCIIKTQEMLASRESSPETEQCNCLPACDSVEYEAEILKTYFNMQSFMKTLSSATQQRIFYSKPTYNSSINYSKLEMYFKKPRFVSMRRAEMFGLIDFLANCGGILGLFLGFSFLSLVELFYFLTLRLWLTLRKDLKEEKKMIKRQQNVKKNKF